MRMKKSVFVDINGNMCFHREKERKKEIEIIDTWKSLYSKQKMHLFLKALVCECHLVFFHFALYIIISIVCLANLTNTKLISNRSSFIGLNAKPVFFRKNFYGVCVSIQLRWDNEQFSRAKFRSRRREITSKIRQYKNVIYHLKTTMASITWISNEWLLTSRIKTVCLDTWFRQLKHLHLY